MKAQHIQVRPGAMGWAVSCEWGSNSYILRNFKSKSKALSFARRQAKSSGLRLAVSKSNPHQRASLNKWIRAKKIRVRRSGGRLLLDIKR